MDSFLSPSLSSGNTENYTNTLCEVVSFSFVDFARLHRRFFKQQCHTVERGALIKLWQVRSTGRQRRRRGRSGDRSCCSVSCRSLGRSCRSCCHRVDHMTQLLLCAGQITAAPRLLTTRHICPQGFGVEPEIFVSLQRKRKWLVGNGM